MRLDAIRVTPQIEAYMESLLPEPDPVLARLESEIAAGQVHGIGRAVGQLLHVLLRAAAVADVLELGTAGGYSAIWLARAARGRVVTVERDGERVLQARRNLAEAGLEDRVEVVEADAIEFLEGNQRRFGCVFNDLLNSFPDVETVERCFQLSVACLEPGGLLLADNALRRGEVVGGGGVQAANVRRYNRLVASDRRLESTLVPLRDGVSIARLDG